MRNSPYHICKRLALVAISGIAMAAACMFTVTWAVTNREQKVRAVLGSYDDVISCYCENFIRGDGDARKSFSPAMAKMCAERKCCIEAFEICGRRYPKFGSAMRKRTATLYADRKKFPSETMYFGTFKLEDGTIVRGLSYVRRTVYNDRRLILEFKCQLE